MILPFHKIVDLTVDHCQEHLQATIVRYGRSAERLLAGMDVFAVHKYVIETHDDLCGLDIKQLLDSIRDCADQRCDCANKALVAGTADINAQFMVNNSSWVVVNAGSQSATTADMLDLDTLYELACQHDGNHDAGWWWQIADVSYDGELLVAKFTIDSDVLEVHVRLLSVTHSTASHNLAGDLADSDLVLLDERMVRVAIELYTAISTFPTLDLLLTQLQEAGFAGLTDERRRVGVILSHAYNNGAGELTRLVEGLDAYIVDTCLALAHNWAGTPTELLNAARASVPV